MADLARFSALFIILCSSPGILREPPFFARERKTFWYLFCPRTPYGSRVSLIGGRGGGGGGGGGGGREEEEEEEKEEEEEEEEEERMIFDFFKIRFLGFYKAEQKSEDIFVLRRVRAFHR